MDYNIIAKLITNASNIYLMPHHGVDLDALGSCLGLYYIAKHYNKTSYIILDEKESDSSINKTKEQLKEKNIDISTYTYDEVSSYIDSNSLLIIVDVNKVSLLQNNTILSKIQNIIILDHHQECQENIPNYTYKYIDESSSSTCEMILSLITNYDVEIPPVIASIMLGGIVIDTDNFTLKTTAKTYDSASALITLGASTQEVQYLLKENLYEYFNIGKAIENTIIVKEHYAICVSDATLYDKEFLAKIASTLLTFDNVEISFAIGWLDKDTVGISSRSLGNIDASLIMKKLGGGGHITNSACQLKNTTLNEAKEKLLNIIKEG